MFELDDAVARKLLKKVQEFGHYIEVNQDFIPNYGERHHYGEKISTAFVESTINWVVSKRMVKNQQMRWTSFDNQKDYHSHWTKRGAHLLLQARTETLNGELRHTFCGWYPGMTKTAENLPLAG